MTMTHDRAIETAADYADALMISRRAKNFLAVVLILLLVLQLTLFFLVRYDVITFPPPPPDATLAAATDPPATQPAAMARFEWPLFLHYIIGITAFLGVTLSIVLALVILLILNIMLVGRLVGAGRLTSAYIWALVAVVFFFPWQAFLNHVGLRPDVATFKIPGVLYTWFELMDSRLGAKFPNEPLAVAILKWFRFVGAPIVAILILLAIQIKSNRGLKQALGEADPTLDTGTMTTPRTP